MNKVFIIPFHVTRLSDSIMPEDIFGAYVSCYSPGENYLEAAQRTLKKLAEDGLYPEEILEPIHEISPEDWSEHISEMWPDQATSLLSQIEFERSMKEGGVVYGPFGSYE